MPEPRVLLLPADETGCGVYRMIYVAKILAERGHDVRVAPPGHPDRLAAFLRSEPRKVQGKWTSVERVERVVIPEADVVVFQRPLSRLYADAMGQLRAAGIKIVVELDDDFRAVSPANGAYRAVHPGYSPEANWQHLDRSLRAAHLVTVSTESLARRYGHKGVERVVLPNYVPAWYLDIPHDPGPARAGWAGAVNTHPFDLQATGGGIASALRRAREDRGPEAGRFTVVGPTTGVAAALGLSEQVVDASDWVPTAQYPAELAKRLTVGVAPLEDTLFNRGKSWLKPLEYAALGIPSVMTPLPEYQALAEAGIGQLATKSNQWQHHVAKLLTDDDYRAEEGARVRQIVADQFTLEAHAHRWWQAWTSVL